jgi:hypothetical protein
VLEGRGFQQQQKLGTDFLGDQRLEVRHNFERDKLMRIEGCTLSRIRRICGSLGRLAGDMGTLADLHGSDGCKRRFPLFVDCLQNCTALRFERVDGMVALRRCRIVDVTRSPWRRRRL